MNPNNGAGRHDLVFTIFVALVFVSVTVSLLHLPVTLNNLIVLGIAFVMAGLVAAQYMGLKWEVPMVDVIVAIPLALFALLVVVLLPDIAHVSIPFFSGH